jgi:hypothetical protein
MNNKKTFKKKENCLNLIEYSSHLYSDNECEDRRLRLAQRDKLRHQWQAMVTVMVVAERVV